MRFVTALVAMSIVVLSAAFAGWPADAGADSSLQNSGLAFPGQAVGTTSAAQTVVLKNNGPATVSISGDSLTGAGAGAFLKTSDSCQGVTLIAGASCTIAYAFAPRATGATKATLTVISSGLQPLPTFALSGTGLAPGTLPAADVTGAPSLSSLTLSARSFRAAHTGASAINASQSTGAYVIYSDSQAATTTFTVERQSRGHYKILGRFTHADAAGTNALRFTGRLAGHALAAGDYRLTASAKSAGGTSAARTVAFKIAS
jgi:hypothetical protein